MDIIEEYARSKELSVENVLKLVDEYTLYAYYLDYSPEIGTRYTSPIRQGDDNPSFTVFYSNNRYYEYLWKDHAMDESGSIFKLIKILLGLRTINEVLKVVDRDFELGFSDGNVIENKIIRYDKPEYREDCIIRVAVREWNEEDLLYWKSQGISLYILKLFNVFPIKFFWTKDSQLTPITPVGLCYAYAIGNYYKVYQPFNKEFKFITNYPSNYVEGFIQLDYTMSDTLIITKSLKEVMWFRDNMSMPAIAGKSESTMVPVEIINYLKERFKRIIVFLDPDPAGYKAAYKYQELYGFEWYTILPCYLTNAKDPTDHNKLYNKHSTIQLISQILSIK